MPRKNTNAGQPNRTAQKERYAGRRNEDEKHRRVLSPGSGDLLRTRIEFVAKDKVAA